MKAAEIIRTVRAGEPLHNPATGRSATVGKGTASLLEDDAILSLARWAGIEVEPDEPELPSSLVAWSVTNKGETCALEVDALHSVGDGLIGSKRIRIDVTGLPGGFDANRLLVHALVERYNATSATNGPTRATTVLPASEAVDQETADVLAAAADYCDDLCVHNDVMRSSTHECRKRLAEAVSRWHRRAAPATRGDGGETQRDVFLALFARLLSDSHSRRLAIELERHSWVTRFDAAASEITACLDSAPELRSYVVEFAGNWPPSAVLARSTDEARWIADSLDDRRGGISAIRVYEAAGSNGPPASSMPSWVPAFLEALRERTLRSEPMLGGRLVVSPKVAGEIDRWLSRGLIPERRLFGCDVVVDQKEPHWRLEP